MERRRLKGKGLASESPTSKEKERREWNTITNGAPLAVREPSYHLQSSVVRYVAPSPLKSLPKAIKAKNQADMEIDKVNEKVLDAMILTEDDLEDLEKSVKEFENLEMDEEILENDDLLDDESGQDAVQIEALSQLSPAHAENQMEPQQDRHQPQKKRKSTSKAISQNAKNKDTPKSRDGLAGTTDPPQPSNPTGVLKRRVPKNPDTKGVKASKKLSAARGQCSPKGKGATSKPSGPSTRKIPRYEVFPSAVSKKSLSLSGLVVS